LLYRRNLFWRARIHFGRGEAEQLPAVLPTTRPSAANRLLDFSLASVFIGLSAAASEQARSQQGSSEQKYAGGLGNDAARRHLASPRQTQDVAVGDVIYHIESASGGKDIVRSIAIDICGQKSKAASAR
jgi:hypothetical protein